MNSIALTTAVARERSRTRWSANDAPRNFVPETLQFETSPRRLLQASNVDSARFASVSLQTTNSQPSTWLPRPRPPPLQCGVAVVVGSEAHMARRRGRQHRRRPTPRDRGPMFFALHRNDLRAVDDPTRREGSDDESIVVEIDARVARPGQDPPRRRAVTHCQPRLVTTRPVSAREAVRSAQEAKHPSHQTDAQQRTGSELHHRDRTRRPAEGQTPGLQLAISMTIGPGAPVRRRSRYH